MSRHRQSTPTEVELEILQVLWERGPSTVREVVEELSKRRPRAYTSILSMLNVMLEKRLVTRQAAGKAHIYQARQEQTQTLSRIAQDVLGRAFDGSLTSLMTHVLNQSQPSEEELAAVQEVIENYRNQRESS